MLTKVCRLRAGIADGGGLEFRPPGTTADKSYFAEVKIKCSALFVPPELKPGFFLLLIALPSSPTIGNTNVVRSPSNHSYILSNNLSLGGFNPSCRMYIVVCPL